MLRRSDQVRRRPARGGQGVPRHRAAGRDDDDRRRRRRGHRSASRWRWRRARSTTACAFHRGDRTGAADALGAEARGPAAVRTGACRVGSRACAAQRADRGLRLVEQSGRVLVVDVDCSKGTYVRVLAEDIGAALGCGAHLAGCGALRVGPLSLDGAVELAGAGGAGAPMHGATCLRPLDALLAPAESRTRRRTDAALRQGQRLAIDRGAERWTRARVRGGQHLAWARRRINELGQSSGPND
jgi:hypothetical protein